MPYTDVSFLDNVHALIKVPQNLIIIFAFGARKTLRATSLGEMPYCWSKILAATVIMLTRVTCTGNLGRAVTGSGMLNH